MSSPQLVELIQFLLKEKTPLFEVRQILRVWPEGAIKEYLLLKAILEEETRVQDEWKDFTKR